MITLSAFILSRSISNPILKLTKATTIIANGNLEYKVGVNTKDEIGVLATAFNKMTTNLKEITASRDELNKEITERKQAEDELKRHQEHLEELVKDRTEALNKQRENFISVLIHDLKGPLVPILGYTRRLIDGKAKSEKDRMRIYKITQEASQNLLKTIEGTLRIYGINQHYSLFIRKR